LVSIAQRSAVIAGRKAGDIDFPLLMHLRTVYG
jgi:hypothetical protein